MKPLDALRRFTLAKLDEYRSGLPDAPADLRAYIAENLSDLAEAFGVTPEKLTESVAATTDDNLARCTLGSIDKARKAARESKGEARERQAQATADAVGAGAHWRGAEAELDLAQLLACCTGRDRVLVFACDAFTIAVPMARLLDWKSLRRSDAWAYVDARGVHLRWGAAGGLNFPALPQVPKPGDTLRCDGVRRAYAGAIRVALPAARSEVA